jgi:hypothetical protein
MENYNHFVTIVAGENPDELMQQYLFDNEEQVVLYRKEDSHKLKLQHIQMAEALLKNCEDNYEKMDLEDIILTLKSQSDDEFFDDLAEDYEIDDEGNIVGSTNEAKFETYNIGKHLSTPFVLKNGKTDFQAIKKDIDWDKCHLYDKDFYLRVWELSVDGDTPLNDTEINVKQNMSNKAAYFSFFGDKETYALHSSAFWGYAFLSEETGWVELGYDKEQLDWVIGYYDNFIEPLSDDTVLTIYECRR